MIIRDPQHTECSNLTVERRVKFICNQENKKTIWPPCYHHNDFDATHASCARVYELPQSNCGDK